MLQTGFQLKSCQAPIPLVGQNLLIVLNHLFTLRGISNPIDGSNMDNRHREPLLAALFHTATLQKVRFRASVLLPLSLSVVLFTTTIHTTRTISLFFSFLSHLR